MTQSTPLLHDPEQHDVFVARHGPGDVEVAAILHASGYGSLDALTNAIAPASICRKNSITLVLPSSQRRCRQSSARSRCRNHVFKSFISQNYCGAHIPLLALCNTFGNSAWHMSRQTQVPQGHMETLIDFQAMCAGLTGMGIDDVSLPDETIAAGEAVALAKHSPCARSGAFLHIANVTSADARRIARACQTAGHSAHRRRRRNQGQGRRHRLLWRVAEIPDLYSSIRDYQAPSVKKSPLVAVSAMRTLSHDLGGPVCVARHTHHFAAAFAAGAYPASAILAAILARR